MLEFLYRCFISSFWIYNGNPITGNADAYYHVMDQRGNLLVITVDLVEFLSYLYTFNLANLKGLK